MENLQPLTSAIAEHIRNQGSTVPPDEELAVYAKDLVSFFEILIKAEQEDIA